MHQKKLLLGQTSSKRLCPGAGFCPSAVGALYRAFLRVLSSRLRFALKRDAFQASVWLVALAGIFGAVGRYGVRSYAATRCGRLPRSADAQPSFLTGPYLQSITESSIIVCWESDVPSDGAIEYWVEGTSEVSVLRLESDVRHEALVSALQPGTTYRYRVKIPAEGEGVSFTAGFRTPPVEETPLSFVVYGDTRGGGPGHPSVAAAIRAVKPAFVIHTGDLVTYGNSTYAWKNFWQAVCPPNGDESLAGNAPLYPVVGNHEYMVPGAEYQDEAVLGYQSYFVLPPNGLEAEHPEWADRFYSFRYGPVFVVVLDVNNDTDPEYDLNNELVEGPPDIHPGSPQYEWLINQLETARAQCPFTFVCFHHSPYSTGAYGRGASMKMRFLDPVFREHGVDAVFSSHDHCYERCETYVDGYRILYFVAGAGGASLYLRSTGWDVPGSWIWDEANQTFYTKAFDNTSFSFIKVDVTPLGGGAWRATFSATRPDGEVFDVAQIKRPWGHATFGETFALFFESTPGQSYQVEYSNDLPGGNMVWHPFGNPILADGWSSLVLDDGTQTGIPPTDSSVRNRFYRVRKAP